MALVDVIAVRHTWCAEHGELVHAAPSQGAPIADVGVAVRPARPNAGEQGHDHCHVLAVRNEPPQASPAAIAAAPAVDAPRPPVTVAPSTSLDLLRLAPKTSPPAA